jgi:uncharacterized membrane protein YhaH (DUF805 family)
LNRRRFFEVVFIALAFVLVALVGALNCLQGTPFMGGSKCPYNYASSDLLVKVLGTILFLLFLGLILGPVAATVIQPIREKQKRRRRTED